MLLLRYDSSDNICIKVDFYYVKLASVKFIFKELCYISQDQKTTSHYLHVDGYQALNQNIQ